MSIEEENKKAVYRLNEAVNKGDFSIFHDLFAPNYVYHTNPEIKGVEGFQTLQTMMRTVNKPEIFRSKIQFWP